MTEKELIEGCRKGDASARRELYERYSGLMYGVCRRYIKDAETARDILHDGFITLYTKIGEFRGDGSFEGWCRRIFVNTALGHLRKKNPLAESAPLESFFSLSDAQASAIEKMSAEELSASIRELPDGYRTILNMYAVEGYSHKEIAEMLGISEGTSRSQYLRAKARLAGILKEKGIGREGSEKKKLKYDDA